MKTKPRWLTMEICVKVLSDQLQKETIRKPVMSYTAKNLGINWNDWKQKDVEFSQISTTAIQVLQRSFVCFRFRFISYPIKVEDVGFRLYILFLIITKSLYCINYLILLLRFPIQFNPMSITEAGQGPLFPSLSKNLKYNITFISCDVSNLLQFCRIIQ